MRSLSWRVKLIGLFVLVLGASLLFQMFYVVPHTREQAIRTTQIHQEDIAFSVARELATDLNQTKDRLIALSKRPEFRSMDLASIHDIIEALAQGSYHFESLFVMNADGWFVEASADDLSAYTSKSYADQPYFTIPFEEGEPYFAPPRFYATTGLVGTSVGVPIESDTGEPVGVLLAVFRLNHLIDLVTNYPLDEEMVLYMVDTKGTAVAHSAIDLFALEEGPLSLDYSDWPMTQAVIAGKGGDSQEYEHEGTPYFCTSAIVNTNGWDVVVTTPMHAILAESSALTRWVLIVSGVLFVGSLGVTLVFGRQIMGAQRRAERALKLSEERFKTIFDHAGDGILIARTEDKRFFMGNTTICEILGYTPEEIATLGVADIHPEESLPDVIEQFEKQLRGEIALASNIPVKRKDGSVFLADIHSGPVTLDEKVYLLGIFRDITERKRAEERIAHLNLVLYAIRNINQLIVRERDRDSLIKGICENLTETRGYHNAWIVLLDESNRLVKAAEAGLGDDFQPMLDRLKRGELTSCARKALEKPGVIVIEDPSSTCEDCPLSKSYSSRGALTVRLEHGGKVYGLLSISISAELVTDEEEQALFEEVTGEIAFGLHNIELEEERERVEGALRAAAQQWRSTFDAIGDVVCLLDVEGRILRCNKAMTNFLGKPFSDILGHSCCELIHSSSEPIEGCPLVRMRETRRRETMVLPVGDRWFNVAVDPLLNENDNLMGAVHLMSDITGRKRAEEQLLVYQRQLRSLVSELSSAEERERRRIAAGLHDQIGQTLVMIKLKLGALREELTRGDLTRQLEEIHGLIEKATQATRSLTFDLAPPVLYELGLEAGLEWLTEKIHEQHGILIEFEDDGQPKLLDDDVRVCLFRAVRELLINVVKHAHARSAKVSIWREGDEVRIVVEDEGVGFDPSELHAPEGRTRGFGLFNIYERLESLGGHVQLESEQGCGTRVTLVNPLKPREGSQKG